jgi:zinc D-Ala-D-Ala carboxypeptidase
LPSAGRAPKPLLPDQRVASSLRTVDAIDPTDIPLARRTVPQALQRRFSWRNALWGAGGVLLVAAGAVALAPLPLRRLLAPPPVQGVKARLSLDGRLLGHFPYAEAPAAELVTMAPGVQLQRDAAEALQALQAAAAADGIEIRVLSAFRSIALQKQIFFDVKSERNQSALERAQVSAPPGFSEHSTGYAVDLGDGRAPATNLSPSFDQTAAYRWLQEHANRFHFHLSFPQANHQGVSYEPWHWRFEGSADALKVFEAAQRLER